MIRPVGTALCLALVAAGAGMTQSPDETPGAGEAYLMAGFTPDPYQVELTGGGAVEAAAMATGCAGFIAAQPDFVLSYNAGTMPLIFTVQARADTTLAIFAPDGNWYCDDDSGPGLNPSLRFEAPQSGRYDIWVGKLTGPGDVPVRLSVSELHGQ
jgi:hypothetical protein